VIAVHGKESALALALGKDFKTKLSMTLYALAILLALKIPLVSCALYVLVALIWLIPDRRIENKLAH
jgi:TMEM175 potassium channel family protein